MSKTQLAYLAGLIDGEGSIAIVKATNKKAGKRGYGFRPVLHVANTFGEVLVKMQKITGLGKVGKFDDARENRKARYQWMVWSQQAAQIVSAVLPYLVIKRRQAEIFIRFVRFVKSCRSPGSAGLTASQWRIQESHRNQLMKLNA